MGAQRVELVYTDAEGKVQGVKRAFSVDSTMGSSDNDFQIKLAITDSLPLHGYAYIDGTSVGGVVDGWGVDSTGTVPVSVWTGRTWSGILNASIVDPGDDHYTMTGEANAAIAALLIKQGLNDVFFAAAVDSGLTLNYQVDRFATAWAAITGALSTVGGAVDIQRKGGVTVIQAVKARNLVESSNGSGSYSASVNTRPVNHLVCTGEGDLADRVVVNLYTDANGTVSQTQTFYGIDEVAQQYDYNNADSSQLIEDGTKKLQELQGGASTCSVSSPAVEDPRIGDYVQFYVPSSGFALKAPVTSIDASVASNGGLTTSIQLGDVMPVKMTGSAGGGVGYSTVADLQTQTAALTIANATE